jgi:hypothetical protein
MHGQNSLVPFIKGLGCLEAVFVQNKIGADQMQQKQVGELAAQLVFACLQEGNSFFKSCEASQEVLLSYPAWGSSSLGKCACVVMMMCQVCILKQTGNILTVFLIQGQNWPNCNSIAFLAS